MPLQHINGQWLHYEDSGGELGPLVLAHGLLMDSDQFAPQLKARGKCRIITWDARSHGETETTDDPFNYWDLADDLRGLLDHLGIEKAVIGGICQGGSSALRFALRHPERVSALILLGTQAGVEDPDRVATYKVMLDVWEADGLNDQLTEMIAAILLGHDWPGRHEWVAKWRQWTPSLLRPAFNALVGRDDIHDRLGEIKAPTLVIHGLADAAVDIDAAQRLCSELANCYPLVAVEGGGHACNLTHPEIVNLAVKQFLAEVAYRTPRSAERRGEGRRSNRDRRIGERRDPVRADPGRRVLAESDRRLGERRVLERREAWSALGARRSRV